MMPKPIHDWLAPRMPGEPLEDVVRYLTWLAQRDRSKFGALEAQVEDSILERVVADMDHKLITDDSVPQVLRESEDAGYILPVTCAYLTHVAWRRTVEKGENDQMYRVPVRRDVWRCWFQATAASKTSRATMSRHAR